MWNSTCSWPRRISPGRSDRGIALPGVLLLAAFLVGVTGWLVGHVRTDLALASAQEDATTGVLVADAALQAAATALGDQVDWTQVAALAPPGACPGVPAALASLDEPTERAWLQAEMDAGSRWAADTPQWQLLWVCHGAGVLGHWPGRGAVPTVAVWVADEPEGDGQPLVSTNQRLLLASVARVAGDARGAVSATVVRQAPGAPVELAAWRASPGW